MYTYSIKQGGKKTDQHSLSRQNNRILLSNEFPIHPQLNLTSNSLTETLPANPKHPCFQNNPTSSTALRLFSIKQQRSSKEGGGEVGGGIENGVKDEREREQLHVHVHGRRRRDLSARSTPRGRRLVSSRLTKEKEKEAGRRVKGVIYRGKRRAGSSGSGHRCNLATPLHGTVRHRSTISRVRTRRQCTLVLVGDGGTWGEGERERDLVTCESSRVTRESWTHGHGRNGRGGNREETGADPSR